MKLVDAAGAAIVLAAVLLNEQIQLAALLSWHVALTELRPLVAAMTPAKVRAVELRSGTSIVHGALLQVVLSL